MNSMILVQCNMEKQLKVIDAASWNFVKYQCGDCAPATPSVIENTEQPKLIYRCNRSVQCRNRLVTITSVFLYCPDYYDHV